MAPIELSIAQARRIGLSAQGFGGRARGVTARHLLAMLERLGALQLDSVNAVVRSHYLPLFSRLGPYPREALDRLAWGGRRHQQLFEAWGHEASLLPLCLQPLLRWRQARAAQGAGIYQGLARFGRENTGVLNRVLGQVAARGPVGAGALSTREGKAGPWWDWSEEKQALEWLFAAGELCVASRRGFERLYDMPERVLPASILAQPTPTEADAQRALLLHAAQALGVATEKDLREYFRLAPADTKARLVELEEEGALLRCKVEHWRQPAWCLPTVKVPRKVAASALLSPFDSLLWVRDRVERLFEFRYRLEFYLPPAKRTFGYYVMPFLHQERIEARVDVRADRASGALVVHALHQESVGLDAAGRAALGEQLQALADWLGLAEVRMPA
ncbi:winged helix-turn-helix domain-containing protein [Pseudomonas typographi]|uniref:winged helix-turn-helix domain-containing protein n=1 Tax=Pseudomonas typographi TaxID=2715964 RepID=UPI001EEEAF1A|nr:crosslink repair DNA glycosylase YcaQ family protein [Pseudomonas typographi]